MESDARVVPPDLSGTKWISDDGEVRAADANSLMRALITDDGAGKAVKRACLEEMLDRMRSGQFGSSSSPA